MPFEVDWVHLPDLPIAVAVPFQGYSQLRVVSIFVSECPTSVDVVVLMLEDKQSSEYRQLFSSIHSILVLFRIVPDSKAIPTHICDLVAMQWVQIQGFYFLLFHYLLQNDNMLLF